MKKSFSVITSSMILMSIASFGLSACAPDSKCGNKAVMGVQLSCDKKSTSAQEQERRYKKKIEEQQDEIQELISQNNDRSGSSQSSEAKPKTQEQIEAEIKESLRKEAIDEAEEVLTELKITTTPVRQKPLYDLQFQWRPGYLIKIEVRPKNKLPISHVSDKGSYSVQVESNQLLYIEVSSPLDPSKTKYPQTIQLKRDLFINGDFALNEYTEGRYGRLEFLTKDSRIITNQFNLDLQVDYLMGERAQFISFKQGTTAPMGKKGRDGGSIEIHAGKILVKEIIAKMNGENGGPGIDGEAYTTRAENGDNGRDGNSYCEKVKVGGIQIGGPLKCFCNLENERGSNGHAGLNGRDGTDGGDGGNSGKIAILELTQSDQYSRLNLSVERSPGLGGLGGKGGLGQEGGLGGKAGANKHCDPARDGENGRTGKPGKDGNRGNDGIVL